MRNLGIKGSPSKERLEASMRASDGQDAGSVAKRASVLQSSKNLLKKNKNPMKNATDNIKSRSSIAKHETYERDFKGKSLMQGKGLTLRQQSHKRHSSILELPQNTSPQKTPQRSPVV